MPIAREHTIALRINILRLAASIVTTVKVGVKEREIRGGDECV